MIGKQLGRYVVLSALGSGGMGDVYVAQDTSLDRRVALKLPRRDVSASVDRLALQREARAAAALNHPNIVHLYSVEEAGGLVFLTMELVPGRSLREILSDATPLGLPRALAFASQIAEGLACAHAAGVLHRDLKPGNVMITADDRVKILDFGVAKFFRPDSMLDSGGATRAVEASTGGAAVGTIGYMSPEQALARTLDARSDLFSLGVMLFEMVTGRCPFEADTPALVFDRLLNRPPQSVLRLNPAVPPLLATIIDKALEKDPERRYRSATDLLGDLARVDPSNARSTRGMTGTAVALLADRTTAPSIVVLPFVDMSPEQDQEYFCHGITEEIIVSLTKIPGLRVISRTSAFALQGKDLDVAEIGRRLRVETVLEGSVRKVADRVRVTAQLVDVQDDHQVWSTRFDRQLSDVFAIQDEVAAAIVNELRSGFGTPASLRRAPCEVGAYDAYLKGMYALNKWTADSGRRAVAEFRSAIAQDARFAPAYAALAEAHVWLYSGLGILGASETIPEARWAVEKALEIDATLAAAHKVRALIAMNHDWDREGSREALAHALRFGPGSAPAHLWNAWRLALFERRYDEALVELEHAEGLDPLDLQLKTQIGYVHYFHHDLDRAMAQFEKVVALEPSLAFAHYAIGDACTQMGQYERAFSEFNRAIELGGRSANHLGVLGYAYGRSGNDARAREHLGELLECSTRGYVSPMWIGLVHLGLGDHTSLFQCLDRAFHERDGSLVLIAAAIEFDPVREDPRFQALLSRMKLEHLASFKS